MPYYICLDGLKLESGEHMFWINIFVVAAVVVVDGVVVFKAG